MCQHLKEEQGFIILQPWCLQHAVHVEEVDLKIGGCRLGCDSMQSGISFPMFCMIISVTSKKTVTFRLPSGL
jgi:hypothetical protein